MGPVWVTKNETKGYWILPDFFIEQRMFALHSALLPIEILIKQAELRSRLDCLLLWYPQTTTPHMNNAKISKSREVEYILRFFNGHNIIIIASTQAGNNGHWLKCSVGFDSLQVHMPLPC